jgi:benzoyl-CoA reductase/2-hydroxyglutaryl-CoA dehydratase subunit BcrC/BadD/HgdB
LFDDESDLFRMVEEAGGRIVLDATETGERTLPAAFDRRRVRDDPLLELANAYFGHIPDAFRRPNSELYVWLARELDRRGVRGILFRRCVWCDTWAAELGRIREWAPVPVLDIDVDGHDDASRARTAGRLRAFLEMLE